MKIIRKWRKSESGEKQERARSRKGREIGSERIRKWENRKWREAGSMEKQELGRSRK